MFFLFCFVFVTDKILLSWNKRPKIESYLNVFLFVCVCVKFDMFNTLL